jgi:hypothetical protein
MSTTCSWRCLQAAALHEAPSPEECVEEPVSTLSLEVEVVPDQGSVRRLSARLARPPP